MRKFIPYGKQYIDQEDIQAVIEVLNSNYITTGPKIAELESKLAKYSGAKYAAVLSNGTAALHAACFAAGIGPGDEVITSPMTFAASANCVLYTGAKPVFADIDSQTYNIDPKEIEKKINTRTKAIIPVHFTGQPCNMDEIVKIAEKCGLTIIEDGAHALGAVYKDRKIGSIGNMTTFSFHPVKHITTGEGGAVTTNDANLYEKLIMFRNHGITRDAEKMNSNHGPWFYEQQALGYNQRMTDIQAALGVSQMKKLESFLEKRRSYAALYNQLLSDIEEVVLPYQAENTSSAWHLYIIRLNLGKLALGRKEVFEELRKRNIGVNVHYIPVYYHPYYKGLGYEKGLCPNAEALYEEIITFPLYPAMEIEDIYYIADNLREILRR